MGPPEDEAPARLRGPGQGGHTLSHLASQPQGGSSVGSPRLGGSIDRGAEVVDQSVRVGGGAIAQRQPRLLGSPLPDVGLGAMVVAEGDRGSSVVTDGLPADAVDAHVLGDGRSRGSRSCGPRSYPWPGRRHDAERVELLTVRASLLVLDEEELAVVLRSPPGCGPGGRSSPGRCWWVLVSSGEREVRRPR